MFVLDIKKKKVALNKEESHLYECFFLSDRPQPPEGPVVFNEIYRNYMVISWNPPLDDGGCAVSNYIIEKRDTNRDLWMPVTSSCTRTSCKVGTSVLRGSGKQSLTRENVENLLEAE